MNDERPSRTQVSSKEAGIQNLQMFKRPFLGYNDEKGNCWSDLENFGNGPSACGHEKGASIVGKALVRVCAYARALQESIVCEPRNCGEGVKGRNLVWC